MVRGEARMKKRRAKVRGAAIMFDEKSRKEFITGFRKRKEERREYGKKLAKEKELEQRKDIKRMHRETVEQNAKETEDSIKASNKICEQMERHMLKKKGLESLIDFRSDQDPNNVINFEPVHRPARKSEMVFESDDDSDSDEGEGGTYTAVTHVDFDLQNWPSVQDKGGDDKNSDNDNSDDHAADDASDVSNASDEEDEPKLDISLNKQMKNKVKNQKMNSTGAAGFKLSDLARAARSGKLGGSVKKKLITLGGKDEKLSKYEKEHEAELAKKWKKAAPKKIVQKIKTAGPLLPGQKPIVEKKTKLRRERGKRGGKKNAKDKGRKNLLGF